MTEGEKLLIQQVSPFVPLQHLQNGSYGAKGHVCSFPQDISNICTKLPRLPSNVNTISIVKSFVDKEGEGQKISFKIRRQKVLEVLRWLKKYNLEYNSIEIMDDNLSWMKGNEDYLPNVAAEQIYVSEPRQNMASNIQKEAYESQTPTDPAVYGYISCPPNHNTLQKKDDHITAALQQSVRKANKNTSIDFPFRSEIPVNEYDTTLKLFCKAFPWLYPGGVGDFNDYSEQNEDIDCWMERLLYYYDGRFARDKMWCFFALNYAMRLKNATAGSYFVKQFYKDCPKTLPELQDRIEKNNFDESIKFSIFHTRSKGHLVIGGSKEAKFIYG